jgi:hypothetical protein
MKHKSTKLTGYGMLSSPLFLLHIEDVRFKDPCYIMITHVFLSLMLYQCHFLMMSLFFSDKIADRPYASYLRPSTIIKGERVFFLYSYNLCKVT